MITAFFMAIYHATRAFLRTFWDFFLPIRLLWGAPKGTVTFWHVLAALGQAFGMVLILVGNYLDSSGIIELWDLDDKLRELFGVIAVSLIGWSNRTMTNDAIRQRQKEANN